MSISVIGGADGPTAIFLGGTPFYYILATILGIAVTAVVIFRLKKRKK